jgi:hypothetical protein
MLVGNLVNLFAPHNRTHQQTKLDLFAFVCLCLHAVCARRARYSSDFFDSTILTFLNGVADALVRRSPLRWLRLLRCLPVDKVLVADLEEGLSNLYLVLHTRESSHQTRCAR